MIWKHPPIIKVYEALGTMADGRIEMHGDSAKVYSSSGNKFYDVQYDPAENAIMSNDNASYWQGTLGYPAIAMLFALGVLEYKPEFAKLLKGIAWKDLNTKFKNNFDKTLAYIEETLSEEDRDSLRAYVAQIDNDIKKLKLNMLGEKAKPPTGY